MGFLIDSVKKEDADEKPSASRETPTLLLLYFLIPSTATFAALATRNFNTVLAGI